MKYSNLANLAFIACPGGEIFADEVITHMKKLYRHKNERFAQELAKRYNLSLDKVIEQINFINEVTGTDGNRPSGNRHTPKIKTQVKFTRFPNGEVKAEIQESIRGKDVYIFQDVETITPCVLPVIKTESRFRSTTTC